MGFGKNFEIGSWKLNVGSSSRVLSAEVTNLNQDLTEAGRRVVPSGRSASRPYQDMRDHLI
jgi:hypothetical protein